MAKVDLSGRWSFCLDKERSGLEKGFYKDTFQDYITLPTTVSEAKKGTPNDTINTGFLTDPFLFEGCTWYSREVEFTETKGKELFLVLERTRTSHVWVDDTYVGSNNSLCTSHHYCITSYINQRKHRLTIMVDNTSYPVKGGHMTSCDTQTNWNGITGGIYLETLSTSYLTGVKIFTDAEKRQLQVKAFLHSEQEAVANVTITDVHGEYYTEMKQVFQPGTNTFLCDMGDKAKLWSEHSPYLYSLSIKMKEDQYSYPFGLRDFKAVNKYFEINGSRTFLRGKHDGLIFPLTGYAPTDLISWLEVMTTAKRYGINHYRFHTCCPPEAAFTAADMLGIYMEPELPFWGTVTEEGDTNHDEKGQQYLIDEGFRILDEFGNHPSFVMMSLGNELWGSKNRLNEILGKYKNYDNRHLYTQGSNNFQFVPVILENEDFFCGVRFSRDRLFRGSYAMCDAPQGHIQTLPPNLDYNYNEMIRPGQRSGNTAQEGDITIQYGTGTKTVKAEASEEIIPLIPVVSHEIGQYAMYPDYSELNQYTGVLKPRNLEVFRKCLEEKGMLPMADKFFQASGRLAAECYKSEIETALRSSELAGFQLLDLQDFAGQGTALVGILNSFMKNKGLISEEEWREFCSETVVLAELPKLVFHAGEKVNIGILLSNFGSKPIVAPKLEVMITENVKSDDFIEADPAKQSVTKTHRSEVITLTEQYQSGIYQICSLDTVMPMSEKPLKLTLKIKLMGTDIENHYDLWLYPDITMAREPEHVIISDDINEAIRELEKGNKVLLFPKSLNGENSIEGTYCTDFWCYPMFRSISESMNKPVPIGTLGLCIEEKHPVFEEFPTQYHTTPQWYDIISNSRSLILDDININPLVWIVDNFERNHRLGLLFEARVKKGKLLVCTSDLRSIKNSLPAEWLLKSFLKYISSEKFTPATEIEAEELIKLFTTV